MKNITASHAPCSIDDFMLNLGIGTEVKTPVSPLIETFGHWGLEMGEIARLYRQRVGHNEGFLNPLLSQCHCAMLKYMFACFPFSKVVEPLMKNTL